MLLGMPRHNADLLGGVGIRPHHFDVAVACDNIVMCTVAIRRYMLFVTAVAGILMLLASL